MLLDALNKLCQSQGHRQLLPEREGALREVYAELLGRKDMLAQALGRFDDVGIDHSKGVGRLPYIPWIRIFSRTYAPKPTAGFFVDFLPTWDNRLYIGLLFGVAHLGFHEIDQSREWARNVLGAEATHDFLKQIKLRAFASPTARKYERAIVLAEEIDPDAFDDDESLLQRVCCQLKLLARIYERVSDHA